jgi:uncharacterized protein
MNTKLAKTICLVTLSMVLHYGAYSQQQKYALIIGVKDYVYAPPLKNTLNDAQDMAAVLKSKGFDV